jgi:hypothetical protein
VPLDIPKCIRVLLAGPFVQKWALDCYPEDIDPEEKNKYLDGGCAGDMQEVETLGKKLNPPDGLSELDLQSYWFDVENSLKPYEHVIIKLAKRLSRTSFLFSDEIQAAIEAQDNNNSKR